MKLAAKLPGNGADGLSVLTETMVDVPEQMHVVLMLVDCKSIATDIDTGDQEPTARIRRIEVISDDLQTAEKMLRRAWERRAGSTVLPLELEDEISLAFRQFQNENRDQQ